MRCWIARSASRTHFRLQFEDFTAAWAGWDIRSSEISAEDYDLLCTTTDEVVVERLHQECWLRGGPFLVFLDGSQISERRNLV